MVKTVTNEDRFPPKGRSNSVKPKGSISLLKKQHILLKIIFPKISCPFATSVGVVVQIWPSLILLL